MTHSILKECVRLILSELQFDRAGYEAAKAHLMGAEYEAPQIQDQPSSKIEKNKEEEKTLVGQQKKTTTSDVAEQIFSQWEKSAGIQFDDKLTRDARPYLNHYARQHPDGVEPSDMRSIINQLNGQFQDQINKLRSAPARKQEKSDSGRDKLSEDALGQVTQKVLDELEKFYNDKKSVPKTRKFDDKSFSKDLQTYLKRELASKDAQKLSTADIEYLVRQARYQFDRYIQSKVKASSK